MIWLMALVGCGGSGECGVAECADICAKSQPAPHAGPEQPAPAAAKGSASEGLSSFESAQVGPVLEDIRSGVRPFGEESVGLCKASGKNCAQYLGMGSSDPLPAGDYMLQAELAVPDAGEKGTWTVELNVDCTTTKKTANGSTTSTNNYNKSYTVFYAGKDRGYRLAPLYKIESPNAYGDRSCEWSLTAPHPDKEATVWKGSFSVPAKE